MAALLATVVCASLFAAPASAGGALAARARPLDWRALMGGDARVVLIGDYHPFKSEKREIVAHLPEFRAAGITAFGFEMFGADHADAIGRACAGSEQKKISKDLGSWGYTTDEIEELLTG